MLSTHRHGLLLFAEQAAMLATPSPGEKNGFELGLCLRPGWMLLLIIPSSLIAAVPTPQKKLLLATPLWVESGSACALGESYCWPH
jgi:hypothetical protein